QGFAVYPLTSVMLKREGRNLLHKYRNNELPGYVLLAVGADGEKQLDDKPKKVAALPEKYNTDFFKFFRLALVGYAAYLASTLAAPVVEISPYVLCLLFGVFARSIGFLERHPLQKANGFGFAIMALLLFIFDGLKTATPQM